MMNEQELHSQNLQVVVAVNEDIKRIIRMAEGINLSAINAMLISKKIGSSSSGFSVVSSELRIFSHKLEADMHVLMELVSRLVKEVAGLIRMNQMVLLLQQTQAGTEGYAYGREVLRRKIAEVVRGHDSIRDCRERLALAIERANKLCVMGVSLSHSAKIEAVYGQEQSGALKHVSEGVEAAIREISSALKLLKKQLEAVA